MALATLSIDLVAKLAELQSGMDKAGRIAAKTAADIEARWSKLKVVAGTVGVAFAGAFSAGALTQLFRATVDGIDKLNDLADATGSTIENISALEDVAVRTGTSIETVGDALVKLNKTLGDASKPGSDAANAIKALGLSAEALKKADPSEALRQVAVALSGYADDGNKARLVQELFGKSIREVAPLLKDLATQTGLTAKVTSEQAQEAEKFNQQLAALSKNSADAARGLVGDLLPALNKILEKNAELSRGGGGFLVSRLEAEANQATAQLQSVTASIASVRAAIDRKGETPFLTQELARLNEQAASLTKRALAASDALKGFSNKGRPLPPEIVSPSFRPSQNYGDTRPSLPDVSKVAEAAKAAKSFISSSTESESFRNALKVIEGTDTAKLAELQDTLSRLFELQRETRGSPAVAEAIARVREEIDGIGKKKLDVEPLKAYQDALAAIADTNTAKLSDLNRQLDELFKLRETRLFDDEQIDEAIENTRKAIEGLKKPLEEVSEFSRQAASNIQSALGDSTAAALEGKFSDIGKIWTRTLNRMVAEASAAQLSEFLFGKGFGKTASSPGGAVGAGIEFLRGIFTGGARADGGPVIAGRSYLVGERGPERFVPTQSGTILPNGFGLPSASISIGSIGSGVSRGEVYAAVRQAQDAGAAAMARQRIFQGA